MRPSFGTLDSEDTPVWEPLVIAIDPGVSTGFAVWSPTSKFINTGQDRHDRVIDDLASLFGRMTTDTKSRTRVIIENFIIPARPVGGQAEASRTIRTIGGVETVCRQAGVTQVKERLPGERNMVTVTMLRRWGWVRDGDNTGRDSNSAMQHLGAVLLESGVVPDRRDVVR